MKILSRIFAISLCALAFLLSGCTEKIETPETPKAPAGYLELLQAYDSGKVILSAQRQGPGCVLNFTDGSSLKIEDSSFIIYDCTKTVPQTVAVDNGWWKVGDLILGIKVDSSHTDEQASVVYAYFDARTLYVYLSNRTELVFNSKALEEENEAQEIERRQNIPVIYITTKNSAPILDKENYVDGTIVVKDPEGLYSDVKEFSAPMGIRGRGNSTWSFPKKPWKLKLKEKASILGMPADKEWCLLANYADRTLLRNIVAMKLSEICGFAWTPRMRSVEVYLNDEYQGVYTFCEHKKISSDRVNLDIDAGDCYLEIEQQQDETTCWWTKMGVPMMFSDPEEPSAAQLAEIKKFFSDFEDCLYRSDFNDPETGYAKYIDVKSFIDYFIVQELTKNTDGNLRKSSFITRKKGQKLVMYHLWDFDLTLGNSGGFLHNPEGYWVKDYNPGCVIGDNWFNRMFRDPAFQKAVSTRWNELLPQLKEIPAFIDRQALYLDKAKDRNFEVWNIWESVDWVDCPSLGSYEKEVEFLKKFYNDRLKWLDREL